jgi:DNA modification methylase
MTANGNLRIEYMRLDEFISRFHPDNPKEHDVGALSVLMAKFGFADLPAIDETSGKVCYGHGRGKTLLANMKAKNQPPENVRVDEDGMWSLPVVRGLVNLEDEHQLKAFLIGHNRSGELGGWHEDKLAELLQELGEFDTELFESTGYDSDDLALMLAEFAPEPVADPGAQIDRAAELQEKWGVQQGDLWQIGEHRLLCGDSTVEEDVARVMGGERAELVLSSPPYPGADMWENGDGKQETIDRLDTLNRDLLQTAWDVLKDNGVCLWNVADVPFGNHGMITTTTTTIIACHEIGFVPRGQIVWNKLSPNLTPPSFMRRPCIPTLGHEFVFLFFKGDWKPREKQSGIPQDDKRWMALSVWDIATASAKSIGHKAPFPIELPRRCLNLWSLQDDVVVDLCGGSGTTMVACQQLGRRCRMIEIAPEYVSVVLQRMTDMGLECEKVE